MPDVRVKLPLCIILLVAAALPSKAQLTNPIADGRINQLVKREWIITGQVKSLQGEPVSNAKIQIRLIAAVSKPTPILMTNVQGQYSYVAELESLTNTSLSVEVSAKKDGYLPAHETATFTKAGETWPLDLLMRPEQEDAAVLSQGDLLAALIPRYKAANPPDLKNDSARQNFARAAGMVADPQGAIKAVPLLSALVAKSPQCAECRTLLGVAELEAGSVSGAQRAFSEAVALKLAPADEPRMANAFLALGVFAEWSGDSTKALALLMKASKLSPQDSLALQEVGRTLVNQKNWEAADEYLLRAEKAGASPQARLLRCRAALEEGDLQAADEEMRAYVAGSDVKTLPMSVRALQTQVHTQISLQSFSRAKTLVDTPLAELLKERRDLEGLEAAPDQSQLAAILQKTGAAVETFFKDFQNATSRERVAELKLGKDGKMKQSMQQQFQYLLLTTAVPGGLSLEEYRTNPAGELTRPSAGGEGFMLSAGFASVSLLFHPEYQGGSRFRHLGRANVNGTNLDVVAFAQIPAKAKMNECFNTPDVSVLVLHQGIAWIDPSDSRIVRLHTDLLAPLPKIRLQRQTTEITYAMVQFKELPAPLSLPAQVTVTVQWKGKTFQNQHQYSDFKLFNTAIKEKHVTPDTPPDTERTVN